LNGGIMPFLDGIASGLDTTALIDSIVATKAQPIRIMRDDLRDAEATKEAVAGLTNRVSDIATALDDINSLSEFVTYSTSMTDDAQFTAIAGTDVTPGTYSITVDSLASAETEVSQGYTDKDALGTLGEGDVTITIGGVATAVTLDSTNSSVQGLADALNDVDGVSAYVLDTGEATDPYKLIVQGQNTGAANAIQLDTSALTTTGVTNPTFTETLTASDAQININGVTVQSASNSVTSIPGLTLDLKNTGTEPVTLTVSEDVTAMADKVEAFVDAYNEAVAYFDKSTAFNPDLNISGGLVGESGARRVMDGLSSIVSTGYDVGGSFTILAEIGFASQQDGTLDFNRTELEDAIRSDPESVQALFIDPGGPGQTMINRINDLYVDEDAGTLTSRAESIENEIEDLNSRIDDQEEYLDGYNERLRTQFIAMEQAISAINGTAGFLGALFASIPAAPTS
jgi:flagellar hook-associated protein 2